MRTARTWFARIGLPLCFAAAGAVGLAVADDTNKATPVPQKPISQAFLDGLVGTWTTESTGIHDGKESRGTGKATWEKGIGETAVLQTYEGSMPGPDGKPTTFYGHGVYKVSDDGKTLTVWWFCNMSPDVMKLSGPITDNGIRISGTSPTGGKFELTAEKSADGLAFKMTEGSNEMRETYKRATQN